MEQAQHELLTQTLTTFKVFPSLQPMMGKAVNSIGNLTHYVPPRTKLLFTYYIQMLMEVVI